MKLPNNHSQAGQDLFAAFCNDFKKNRFFLDCGCNEPIKDNNSYFFESQLNWYGIVIDCVSHLVEKCVRERKAHSLCTDLSRDGLTDILDRHHAPGIIDYVSHDLDGDEARLFSIKSLDFSKYKVRCLTFEHDRYIGGDRVRNESRDFLEKSGMYRLCSDVRIDPFGEFEDWYVNPELVDFEKVKLIECQGVEYKDILEKIRVCVFGV